jgi:uncharacterized protein (DUF362 family)
MDNSKLRKRVLWFINAEIERVLFNLKSGAVNVEHALGSFNTLYQIASSIRDADSMINLCKLIEKIRNADHRIGLYNFTEKRKESFY